MTKQMKWLIPAMLVAGGLTFNSCSEPDSVGIEVQPNGDQPGLYFTDTITIEANTINEDSLRSDEGVAAFNLAGSYTDNVFGLSRATFFTQFFLPNNSTNFTFGTDPVLDSVVLTLAYADYLGDTLTPMNVEVLQLDELMVVDSNYYTNDVIANNGQQLFNGLVDVRPKDSLTVSGYVRAPHLRLKLDAAWGTSFLTSSSSNFLTNTSFVNYFKGIQVKTADVTAEDKGCIMSFNLLSAMSKLTFYFKNGTDTVAKTANFEVNSGCPRFNRYEHDYTMADFGSTFPAPGDNFLYVQSMSGTKVRLKFPHIRNLSALGPVSINKAELVLPVVDNTLYKNHTNLIVFGVDSAGSEALIPDLLESSAYYGGAYSATDKNYKFNIGRYIQQLVSNPNKSDYGISLVSSGGAINAFRTIIPGPATAGTKIQLKVTYSKLD